MRVGLFVLSVKQRALHDFQDSLLGGAIFIHGSTHLQHGFWWFDMNANSDI